MLNGIGLNDELTNTQLNGVSSVVTNPINNPYKTDKNLLIDESAISNEALQLYQKDVDIQKFTNLATSNPEDLSHDDIIESLFTKGSVSDPLDENFMSELSSNKKLLNDLGL